MIINCQCEFLGSINKKIFAPILEYLENKNKLWWVGDLCHFLWVSLQTSPVVSLMLTGAGVSFSGPLPGSWEEAGCWRSPSVNRPQTQWERFSWGGGVFDSLTMSKMQEVQTNFISLKTQFCFYPVAFTWLKSFELILALNVSAQTNFKNHPKYQEQSQTGTQGLYFMVLSFRKHTPLSWLCFKTHSFINLTDKDLFWC